MPIKYFMTAALAVFAISISAHAIPSGAVCGGMSNEECGMFNAINTVRTMKELPRLDVQSKCVAAAGAHAEAMVRLEFFDHDGPHEVWNRRMKRFGLIDASVGENIAWGPGGIERIVRLWMKSPGHRKNILGKYVSTGIGVAHDRDGNRFWVQCFSGLPGDRLLSTH